jgi:lipopolysaccharide/colanic/teichoic acid biosynthesis glycosyltransferase
VDIVFTGLRPGEKLFEELHSDAERTRITRHERILVWDMDPIDESALERDLAELERLAALGEARSIKSGLHRLVPEYVEPEHEPLAAVSAASLPAPVIELPVQTVRPSFSATASAWVGGPRRWFDRIVAAALLVLASPLWLLLQLEAQAKHTGPLLREFRIGRTRRVTQRRVRRITPPIDRRNIERRTQDLLGSRIECLRFRTDLGPVSRWVGRHRLDKLPFLLNVLRGEMALVGPKPEKAELVLRWKGMIPGYARRFSVLPGVTGLAQVSGCPDATLEGVQRRVDYDLHYIENQSLLLDLRTLARTIAVVLWRPRALAGRRPAGRPDERSAEDRAAREASG